MTRIILIVDDQPKDLQVLADYLKEYGGFYEIMKAPSANIALKLVAKRKPDLIITDWEMPGMDGIEFVKELKKDSQTIDIPVIMCTGIMTQAGNLKTALEAGAVDFIRKPVEKLELWARVHSMLQLSESIKKIKDQNKELQTEIDERHKIERKLKKYIKLFEAVIMQAPFASHVIQGSFENPKVVIENEESCRIMGGSFVNVPDISENNSKIVKTRFFTVDGKTEIPLAKMPSLRVFKGEIVAGEEYLFVHSNGKKIIVQVNASPIYYENNEVIAVVVTFHDITERKKIEQALKESETRFKVLHNASFGGISIHDKGITLDCNMGLSDMTGYSVDELIGMDGLLLIAEESRNKVMENILSGCEKLYEAVGLRKNGTEFPLRLESRNIPYKGKMVRIVEFRDITEQKKTELELIKAKEKAEDSEVKFREMAEMLPQIVFESDILGNLTYVNKQAYKLLGYPEQDLFMGKSTLDFYIPADKARAIENVKLRLAGDKSESGNEYTLCRKDGSTLDVLVYSNTILKENKPVGLRGVIVDITERKKIEIEMNESEAQLRELNATKDKFFSIIAHDLKNPFNALNGFSKLLLDNYNKYNDEKRLYYISIINKSIKQTYNLLENLLTWSRSQSGKIEYMPQEFDLKILLLEVKSGMQAQADKKNIEILDEISDDELILADKDMIATVFRNLISNAIKYSTKKGCIKISSQKNINNKHLTISITDTGVGIPKEKIDDLFRIDKNTSTQGTENESGTGLGLVLCKEFVEKNGGEIWVESEMGKGSSFNFTMLYTNNIEKKVSQTFDFFNDEYISKIYENINEAIPKHIISELTDKLNLSIELLLIEDINIFNKQLLKTGQQYNIEELVKHSILLQKQVEALEFSNFKKHLQFFEVLFEKIK